MCHFTKSSQWRHAFATLVLLASGARADDALTTARAGIADASGTGLTTALRAPATIAQFVGWRASASLGMQLSHARFTDSQLEVVARARHGFDGNAFIAFAADRWTLGGGVLRQQRGRAFPWPDPAWASDSTYPSRGIAASRQQTTAALFAAMRLGETLAIGTTLAGAWDDFAEQRQIGTAQFSTWNDAAVRAHGAVSLLWVPETLPIELTAYWQQHSLTTSRAPTATSTVAADDRAWQAGLGARLVFDTWTVEANLRRGHDSSWSWTATDAIPTTRSAWRGGTTWAAGVAADAQVAKTGCWLHGGLALEHAASRQIADGTSHPAGGVLLGGGVEYRGDAWSLAAGWRHDLSTRAADVGVAVDVTADTLHIDVSWSR